MFVLDSYEFFRIPGNRLLVGSTAPFEREEKREKFLARLENEGFKLRRKNGEEIFLKPILADINMSISGQECLLIEIDNSLDEKALL